MRTYRNYSNNDLIEACKTSFSYAEVLRKLGLVVAGGNYKNLQRLIDKLCIDTSHMTHQAHNQGKELVHFDNLIRPTSIKRRLIRERGYSCQMCGLDNWMDSPITLELDHIDGNNRNNSKENLRLLCPNCHSLTPTWRRRNK